MPEEDTEKSTTCPHCGYQIKKDVEFCPECGGKLRVVNYCPRCGAVPEKNEKFCANCGENLIAAQIKATAPFAIKRPDGVTILCFLWFIGGLYNVFVGFSGLTADIECLTWGSSSWGTEAEAWISWAIPTEAVIMATVALLGILQFVIIYGLWTRKRWAYKLGIAIPIVGMITNWSSTLLIITSIPYFYAVDISYNVATAVGSVIFGIIYIGYLRQAHVKKWLHIE
jgi:RNA polymerase subunit RPABC4/transcription elongation factor Spt4